MLLLLFLLLFSYRSNESVINHAKVKFLSLVYICRRFFDHAFSFLCHEFCCNPLLKSRIMNNSIFTSELGLKNEIKKKKQISIFPRPVANLSDLLKLMEYLCPVSLKHFEAFFLKEATIKIVSTPEEKKPIVVFVLGAKTEKLNNNSYSVNRAPSCSQNCESRLQTEEKHAVH